LNRRKRTKGTWKKKHFFAAGEKRKKTDPGGGRGGTVTRDIDSSICQGTLSGEERKNKLEPLKGTTAGAVGTKVRAAGGKRRTSTLSSLQGGEKKGTQLAGTRTRPVLKRKTKVLHSSNPQKRERKRNEKNRNPTDRSIRKKRKKNLD